jgi:hypothetical protein
MIMARTRVERAVPSDSLEEWDCLEVWTAHYRADAQYLL